MVTGPLLDFRTKKAHLPPTAQCGFRRVPARVGLSKVESACLSSRRFLKFIRRPYTRGGARYLPVATGGRRALLGRWLLASVVIRERQT